MIPTSLAIGRVDPRFSTDNVITMRTSLSDPRFSVPVAADGATTVEHAVRVRWC